MLDIVVRDRRGGGAAGPPRSARSSTSRRATCRRPPRPACPPPRRNVRDRRRPHTRGLVPRKDSGILSTLGYTVIVFNGECGTPRHRAALGAQLAGRGSTCSWSTIADTVAIPGCRRGGPRARRPRGARLPRETRGRRSDADRVLWRIARRGGRASPRARVPAGGAVLRSPFTSLSHWPHHYPFLPVRWLLRDRYPSIERIARVTSPLLIEAGEDDEIVPIANSARSSTSRRTRSDSSRFRTPTTTTTRRDGPILIRAIVDLLEGADALKDEEA